MQLTLGGKTSMMYTAKFYRAAFAALREEQERNETMSLIKCPECGEMFSDSYKSCPFCLEDEEFYNGRKSGRGRRVEKHKAPSILGPAMVLVVLLLVGFLGYFFLWPAVQDMIGGEDQPEIQQPVDDDKDNENQGGNEPMPPADIVLSQTSATVTAGESVTLTASGAENITWSSSDEAVATVDENGKVTAVGAGSATITASSREATSAACVVTVNPAKKDLVLQSIYGTKNDISISVGSTAPMEVVGTDSTVQWSMEDSSIATVDGKGNVKGVKRGKTKVIAKVDGQTLTCIVRVG